MQTTYTDGNITYGADDDHLTVLRMNGQLPERYPFNQIGFAANSNNESYSKVEVLDINFNLLFFIHGNGAAFDNFVKVLFHKHSDYLSSR